jgi:hypothetical protein
MILTALMELAQREGLVTNPDFESVKVRYVVRLGPGGVVHGIQDTHGPPQGKEAGRPRAQPFNVPKRSKRTTQNLAEFLVDKAEYVFGWGENSERAKKRHELYVREIRLAFENTKDEALGALVDFLEALSKGSIVVDRPQEWAPEDWFGFVYAPDQDGPRLISSRPAVVAYWTCRRREREKGKATAIQCLVTGALCDPVRLHPKVKGIPPVSETKGGVPLTSINAEAFDSYELGTLGGAPVSPEAADAYEKALNRLLDNAYPNPEDGSPLPKRNFRLSEDTVVVYWSRAESSVVDLFADAVEADPEAVHRLFTALRGKADRCGLTIRPPSMPSRSPELKGALPSGPGLNQPCAR